MWCNKRILLTIVAMLAMGGMLQAQYRSAAGRCHHYISLGIGGGAATTFASSEWLDITNGIGADGQFSLGYELRKGRFFFGLSGEAQYNLTRQSLPEMMDAFPRVDKYGDPHTYRYMYSDYRDMQHTVAAGGSLHFGCYFTPHFYGLVGCKATFPVFLQHRASATLETDGIYDRFIEPFKENESYAFYTPGTVTNVGPYMLSGASPFVIPRAELGARIPLAGLVSARIGAYAEYAIPITAKHESMLIDYSGVDIDPHTQNREQLYQSLGLGCVLDNFTLKQNWSRLEVGIRFTVLFNLVGKPVCTTCLDDSGISYSQPHGIRKRNDTKIRF